MSVHYVHDLGQESPVKPYEPVEAVCGLGLREAHEIAAPESDGDVCPECLSWSKRNRYQNRRCAVEMSARAGDSAAPGAAEGGRISAETDAR